MSSLEQAQRRRMARRSTKRGPCLECGQLVVVEPAVVAACVVADRTVPFIACEDCRDLMARRVAQQRLEGLHLDAIGARQNARRSRLARRHLETRVLPIAEALLANALALVSEPGRAERARSPRARSLAPRRVRVPPEHDAADRAQR